MLFEVHSFVLFANRLTREEQKPTAATAHFLPFFSPGPLVSLTVTSFFNHVTKKNEDSEK